MSQNKQPRFSKTASVAIALAAFPVLVCLSWFAISLMVALFFSSANPTVLMAPQVMLATTVVAAIVGFILAWAVYTYASAPREFNETNTALRFSRTDWCSAIFSGVALWFVLALLAYPMIKTTGVNPLSTEVILLHGVMPALLSIGNVGLVLRGKRRKRLAAERERLIAAGRYCGCGYDLKGNVSGVCPECGSAIRSG